MSSSTVCKLAIVAALEREIATLIRNWKRTRREYEGRTFTFFEREDIVAVCGGIGLEAARRASQAVSTFYHPQRLHSVGFAGALTTALRAGNIFSPAVIIDARDGSRYDLGAGQGTLVTFMAVAGAQQKAKLAEAYRAVAVDMEAAAVASAARAHGITFGSTKAISDELNFEIPSMARFINSEGQFRTASFIAFATLRPWLWNSIATLASNTRKAEKALSTHLKYLCEQISNIAIPKTTSPGTAAGERPLPAGGGK
jgi:adenosylhomocysteine nucleosidase